MCGICGIVDFESVDHAEAPVRAMVDRLEHRGPDEAGVATLQRAVFGATRLEIRAGASGRQPMVHDGGQIVVACNGEIDNHEALREWLESRGHRFSDRSDVAILPALYAECGEDFVSRLEGPFALAVWDEPRGRLLLARDRVGERPLYFRRTATGVVFATELGALSRAIGEEDFDLEAIHEYLRSGWFSAPRSPFREVQKVAPAQRVLIDAQGVTRERTWRWPLLTRTKASPDLERFDRILHEAVRRQIATDTEFGVFLSGGLDSGLVAAIARDLEPDRPIPSYTLRFSEDSFDEGESALRIAEHLRLSPREVWVRAEDFPETLARLVRSTGEPLGDPAWIPTALLARTAAREVPLVLVGEGGDEVFGGYPTYLGPAAARVFGRIPSPLRNTLAAIIRRWPPSDKKVTVSFLLKKFVEGWQLDPVTRHLQWTALLSPELLRRVGVDLAPRAAQLEYQHPLDALQLLDLESSMAEGLLTKVDRAAMNAALEPRAPFLDAEVMDFASSLPPEERVHRLTTKRFLKRYAHRHLPSDVVEQKKRGLSVPLSSWMRGPLQSWAREKLGGEGLRRIGVDVGGVLELFDEHVDHRADHGRALWNLLTLAEWVEWRLHDRS